VHKNEAYKDKPGYSHEIFFSNGTSKHFKTDNQTLNLFIQMTN